MGDLLPIRDKIYELEVGKAGLGAGAPCSHIDNRRPPVVVYAVASPLRFFGQLSPELTYFPPPDVLPVLGKSLIVDVSYGTGPVLTARLVVPPRYDCPQFVNLSGRNGREGRNGSRGRQ